VRHFLSLCLTVSLTLLSGCQIDLPIASTIEHLRILTAIAEVEGDRERSSPKPGETVHVTWQIAWPEPQKDDSELSTLFYVCTAPTIVSGTPVCQELIDLASAAIQRGGNQDPTAALGGAGNIGEQSPCADAPNSSFELGPIQVVCVTGTPKLDIRIPDNYKAEAKLMKGVTCRNGTPRFSTQGAVELQCDHPKGAKNAEEISFYGTVPIQYDADSENHNPSADALSLQFHKPPLLWETTDAELDTELSDEACPDLVNDGRVMRSDGKEEEEITLRYEADAREEYMGKPEPLTFSAYTTYGEISDRFTVFRADAKTPLKRTITWQLSDEQRADLKKTSKYVRFYFTVTDGRGGYAVTHRDLCVVR
jgi:hypothetical protein